MVDRSDLDRKYFIDQHVYNCPFCNRRNVAYSLTDHGSFDWDVGKKGYHMTVECDSCCRQSIHFSFSDLVDYSGPVPRAFGDLDKKIFHSIPSSFFTTDERIPRPLRELFTEAEGCLKHNYLTGASACARKIVYELSRMENADGPDYESRIKSLKKLLPAVPTEYFDTLVAIQSVTSDKVHEQSYDGWESRHLRVILATLVEILNEIYVVPAKRRESQAEILELKRKIMDKGSDEEEPGGEREPKAEVPAE